MTISYRGDGISLLVSWGDCARGATAVALKSVGKIGPTKSLPIRLRIGRGSDPEIFDANPATARRHVKMSFLTPSLCLE